MVSDTPLSLSRNTCIYLRLEKGDDSDGYANGLIQSLDGGKKRSS